MENTIKRIEEMGYIVKARDNMERGEISKTCPVVYEIMDPDYTTVYGANAVGPASLELWIECLTPVKNEEATTGHSGVCPKCGTYCFGDCES